MKTKIYIFSLLVALLFSFQLKAQTCPATGSISATTNSTANTCAGNGSVTVNFPATTNIALQILKGGTILNTVNNPSGTTHTWAALQAGTDYEVRIVCATDNSIIAYSSAAITVADLYQPISDAVVTVSDVCTTFAPGGTITVPTVTGGNAPYTYSFYLSDDPAYSDALSTYQTSNTKSVTTFGTYQIRVKDACGNYKTFTRTLSPALPKIEFHWKPHRICGSTTQATGSSWYTTNGDTGAGMNENQYIPPGIKLKIQADNSAGAVLFDGIYDGNPFVYTMSASHRYFVTTTNACGIENTYYSNLTDPTNNPEFSSFFVSTGSAGCGASELMTITSNFSQQSFWDYPLTVTVTSAVNPTGPVVATQIVDNESELFQISGLPMGDYLVTVTDSCGETLTKPAPNPVNNGAPQLVFDTTVNWRCGDLPALTQTGTIQAVVRIDGYFPDRANAVVKIIAGPSNVGVIGQLVDGQKWGWSNLSPGTYTVEFSSCGISRTGTFTINPGSYLLQQSLSSTGTSFCSGGGNINSTKVYNGSYTSSIQLLNEAGTVIAENVNGNFTNIPAGTYTTRMKIVPWCNNGAFTYYIDGSTVILTDSTTGPSISSAVGIICEDSAGNPLSTGTAYLRIAGVAPYVINYRIAGSSDPYTTINTSNTNVELQNLTANTIYEVAVIDACGGSDNTTVQIKTMGNLVAENTAHPCVDAPYSLIMKSYAGATYQWTDPAGNVISDTRIYSFANYQPSNDGVYAVKITWSNCVTRTVFVTLNSNLCGQPIGNSTIAGNIFNDGNALADNTVNGTPTGTAGTQQLYISLVSSTGTIITTVPVNADGTYSIPGLTAGNYSLVLSNSSTGSAVSSPIPGWNFTGENIGAAAGNDGTPNGVIAVNLPDNTTVSNVNFGISGFCYRDAVTSGDVLSTNHGITALGRAGSDNSNWPMVRKGAWTVLEARTKGFVVNRLTDAQIDALPADELVEGMMVYNITQDCLQINVDGTSAGWKCYTVQTCPN